MAYTQADLDAVRAAMVSGTKTIRFEDGRMVEKFDLSDLMKLESVIDAQLKIAANAGSGIAADPRRRFMSFSRGL